MLVLVVVFAGCILESSFLPIATCAFAAEMTAKATMVMI